MFLEILEKAASSSATDSDKLLAHKEVRSMISHLEDARSYFFYRTTSNETDKHLGLYRSKIQALLNSFHAFAYLSQTERSFWNKELKRVVKVSTASEPAKTKQYKSEALGNTEQS